MTPFISADNTWALWAIMAGAVALGIYLEKRYAWAKRVSALVLVLLFGILLSNIGLIPTESAVYDTVWDYLVPLALPMLLFHVDLKKIGHEAGALLVAFLISALGTIVGGFVSTLIFRRWISELSGLAAMMTGTYIGGSVNFMALADTFGVSADLVSAATIADNLNMAIYFFILLSIPVKNRIASQSKDVEKKSLEPMTAHNLSMSLAAAFVIVAISIGLASIFDGIIPSGNLAIDIVKGLLGSRYLWITTVAVFAATAFPGFFAKLTVGQAMGTYIIYCFMFVIGAPASVSLIIKKSPVLLIFAMVIVAFNMLFTFTIGNLFGLGRDLLIIASNAAIGGPTTAASMCIAKGWDDLVGPALLVGSLGYVLGNYAGILVGYSLSL